MADNMTRMHLNKRHFGDKVEDKKKRKKILSACLLAPLTCLVASPSVTLSRTSPSSPNCKVFRRSSRNTGISSSPSQAGCLKLRSTDKWRKREEVMKVMWQTSWMCSCKRD
ncbi:hypothetical protein KC19_1G228400 [Ceratodon purpureus]|uniref:Uncharacterized protein n=1 Tax=Ceratodon purpureus TaxID=3225 RepID=A0A8T0JB25_CERPU|nr:hypothetical protein KC19_1G228400 [Ceratodon purpureus]